MESDIVGPPHAQHGAPDETGPVSQALERIPWERLSARIRPDCLSGSAGDRPVPWPYFCGGTTCGCRGPKWGSSATPGDCPCAAITGDVQAFPSNGRCTTPPVQWRCASSRAGRPLGMTATGPRSAAGAWRPARHTSRSKTRNTPRFPRSPSCLKRDGFKARSCPEMHRRPGHPHPRLLRAPRFR